MKMKSSVLSTREIKKIHEASIEVLENTGVVIENDSAVTLMLENGANIIEPYRVKIPKHLIQKAMLSTPYPVILYDRLGNLAMELDGERSYFGTQVNCLKTIDPISGEHRQMKLEHIQNATRVADALPNMDFISCVDVAADASPEYAGVAAFATVLTNTVKPIAFPITNLETGEMILEMAAEAVGGVDQLKQRPFVICVDSPISPLFHQNDAVRSTMFAAKRGLPYLYNPIPQGGLTAPTKMAGVLVVAWAEILTGLLITQLVNPGTPFICGGVPSIFDMRDTCFVYGSPELFLMCSALTEIAHYHQLPHYGTAGVTNSKIFDTQAATDASLSSLMAVLNGSDLVHDVGMLDIGVAHSNSLVVLTDEIAGMAKKIKTGIEVSPETLAIDIIKKVGPKGSFIEEEHTYKHFKECWYPRIFDHTAITQFDEVMYCEERIRDFIREILDNCHPANLPKAANDLIARYAHYWKIENK